jgi:hypothetical protein
MRKLLLTQTPPSLTLTHTLSLYTHPHSHPHTRTRPHTNTQAEYKGTVEKTHPLHDAKLAAKVAATNATAAPSASHGRRMLAANATRPAAPRTVNHFKVGTPSKLGMHANHHAAAVQVKHAAHKGNATHKAAAAAPAAAVPARAGRLLRGLLSML